MSPTDSVPLKRCSSKENCIHPDGPYLPATSEYFHKKTASKDGLNTFCMWCNRERMRLFRASNPDYNAAYMAAYREEFRDEVNANKREHYQLHRDEILARNTAYRWSDPEREHNRKKLYYRNNKSKVIASNSKRKMMFYQTEGTYTEADIAKLYDLQDGRCGYCGIPVHDEFHIDHMIPLSKGGTNYPDNLCIACPTCNLVKHDRSAEEWQAQRGW